MGKEIRNITWVTLYITSNINYTTNKRFKNEGWSKSFYQIQRIKTRLVVNWYTHDCTSLYLLWKPRFEWENAQNILKASSLPHVLWHALPKYTHRHIKTYTIHYIKTYNKKLCQESSFAKYILLEIN